MNLTNKHKLSATFISRIVCFAILALSVVTVTASAQTNVPSNLKTIDNEKLALHLAAIGVQIYTCSNIEGKTPAWTFLAPEADLFLPPTMQLVGKHDAGPNWALNDGSKVTGKVMQRADATNLGAIPSLLLSATSVGGAGKLDKVSRIQRLNTVGGVAPTTGCTVSDIGKQSRVYYTADYYFYIRQL